MKKGRRHKVTISVGVRIVKVCWACMGTGWLFCRVAKPRFKPCGDCGGAGGVLSD